MNDMIDPVLLTIAGCEIGFWLLVVGGLVLRYLARAERASTWVLAAVPILDLVLLVAVAIDLSRGSEVGFAHRVAPIYLGTTVVFGPRLIRWADVRFAHRFAGGPAPVKVPKRGPERMRHEWADFARWVAAAGIAAAVLALLGFTVADPTQRDDLFGGFQTLGVITAIWLLTGPVWYAGSGRREATTATPDHASPETPTSPPAHRR
ncbi:hypothetical protein [Gordonia neofelifaecis]|uniref:Uncharacterized protein n=1 Tax=Gordonia neofelifaecis NRRL B-59395 TaxID=644548 RepID=F1YEL0_9ACTN|nr:hypothetical protein [Gordonia neofelifaecis]EGD56844.1 hypothetical protein SCNU_00660 [Gordonia neofelifaecis NRRL B-59395]